jgi:hypothetical protein
MATAFDNNEAETGLTHTPSNVVAEVEKGTLIRLKPPNECEIDGHQDHGIPDVKAAFQVSWRRAAKMSKY